MPDDVFAELFLENRLDEAALATLQWNRITALGFETAPIAAAAVSGHHRNLPAAGRSPVGADKQQSGVVARDKETIVPCHWRANDGCHRERLRTVSRHRLKHFPRACLIRGPIEISLRQDVGNLRAWNIGPFFDPDLAKCATEQHQRDRQAPHKAHALTSCCANTMGARRRCH